MNTGKRLALLSCLLCLSLLSLQAQPAGPRDNPLLEPKLPTLPDLYGTEKKQAQENDEAFIPPPAEPPARVQRQQPATLQHRAGIIRQASAAMRSDLQRQIAAFHALSGEPDRALSHLLAAQARGWLQLTDRQIALDAARLYTRLNLPAAAESLYSALPEWQTAEDERQHFLLSRVRSHYNRREYRTAETLLKQLGTPANPEISNLAESLRIRIWMAQGNFAKVNSHYKESLGRPRNSLYNRYNLGVSMVAAGQTDVGIGQLDELGQIPAIEAEPLALRDQANLSLGWAYLQADQGATARPFLRRIRIDGPLANRALLALGWALLAPDGEPQQKILIRLQNCIEDPAQILQNTTAVMRRPAREACGKPKTFRYRRDLAFEPASKNRNERLAATLAPWNKLIEGPDHDPSVQEALLARGYVYEQMPAPAQAVQVYRDAIQRLEQERNRLTRARERLQARPFKMIGKPDSETEIYLSTLMNSLVMQETVQSLRGLKQYSQRLSAATETLSTLNGDKDAAERQAAQLHSRLASLKASYESVLRRQIQAEFQRRDEQLGQYLKRARLALVKLHGAGA